MSMEKNADLDDCDFFPDYDECTDSNGGCNQNCRNLEGSHECHCNDGFILDGDGKTCKGKTLNKIISRQKK